MREGSITKAYEVTKERYAALGMDIEKVMEQLQKVVVSMHCWQADDAIGSESGGPLTGDIQTIGNYPGKAHNMEELRNDTLKATSYILSRHRLNLHEIYGNFDGAFVDRNQIEVKHFESWMQWAAEDGMELDFNLMPFSHPKSDDLFLSSPDKDVCDFWIEHTKRCHAIVEEMGRRQGDPYIMNFWVHNDSEDVTINRMRYRELFRDPLNRIFATEYRSMEDCLESKVFGIGLESYTVGSSESCVGYSVQHRKLITIDTGHFHPTESAADKVSSILLFVPELMLHISRPICWDSDHVTVMDDPTLGFFQKIVRCNASDRVHIGLDHFDASTNRIGAHVIGTRTTQKCMLRALLEPLAKLREYEVAGQGSQRLALLKEIRALPWNAVWDMFCSKNNVPVGEEFIPKIEKCEVEVTSKCSWTK